MRRRWKIWWRRSRCICGGGNSRFSARYLSDFRSLSPFLFRLLVGNKGSQREHRPRTDVRRTVPDGLTPPAAWRLPQASEQSLRRNRLACLIGDTELPSHFFLFHRVSRAKVEALHENDWPVHESPVPDPSDSRKLEEISHCRSCAIPQHPSCHGSSGGGSSRPLGAKGRTKMIELPRDGNHSRPTLARAGISG